LDGYEKIVRCLMADMTDLERKRLLEAIRATNNPENPFWADSLNQVEPGNVKPES
jgi:hypothetical protein